MPGLLRILELKNCIITIDAMGCYYQPQQHHRQG